MRLQYVSGNFTTWRWLVLVGCLAPAYWAAEGIARLFEMAVEWRFFEDRRVLYYLIGTTVSATIPKQLIAWLICWFAPDSELSPDTVPLAAIPFRAGREACTVNLVSLLEFTVCAWR